MHLTLRLIFAVVVTVLCSGIFTHLFWPGVGPKVRTKFVRKKCL